MNLETVHNLIITMHNSTNEPEVRSILGATRLQLEALLVKNAPVLSNSEVQLPTKIMRVNAYKTRTGVSASLAHAVVNSAWRDACRDARDSRAYLKQDPINDEEYQKHD